MSNEEFEEIMGSEGEKKGATMNKEWRLKRECMQSKAPIMSCTNIVVALKVFNAPEWLWGIMVSIMVLVWVAFIKELVEVDYIDIAKLINYRLSRNGE